MAKYNVFKKKYTIGEYEFTLAINRQMAVNYFRKYPDYYDSFIKIDSLQGKYKDGEPLTAQDILEVRYLTEKAEEASEDIVREFFGEMLAYAYENGENNGITDFYDYAEKVLAFCDENELLYNSAIEDENGETQTFKGLFTLIMEFISLGFIDGNGKPIKKPTMKIIVQ